MEICIDFDGTCVAHDYPNIGMDIGAVPVLQEITNKGHKLILFTMRYGKTLDDAVNWFEQNKIPLYGININPTQRKWTQSPKAYGQLYIDDSSLGCPLLTGLHSRPFINWVKVRQLLKERNII